MFVTPSEWYKKHGSLPPVDWWEKVYEAISDLDTDMEVKGEFRLWYFEEWLPKAAGYQFYGPNIRYYKSPVAGIKIGNLPRKQSCVSQESEAFAILVIKNCYDKWEAICPKKIQDPDWEIPNWDKDDTDTHPYHKTLWSDGKTGQVKGGGWAPEAYDALSQILGKIKAFRKADKANGWKVHNEMLELLRSSKGITEAVPSNKRKRSTAKPKPVYNDIAEYSDECADSDEEDGE